MHVRHAHIGKTPHGNRLILSFAYRSHARTFALPHLAALIVFVLIPIIAIIYLAATCYFIFHDDVLAGLMQRQADMQYAYEDRIAALRRDVENANQRADTETSDFTARLHALAQRQDQVESRTALIAAFADRERQIGLPPVAGDAAPANAEIAPAAAAPPSAAEVSVPPHDGKPHPDGFDLRLQDGPHPALPFSTSDAAPAGATDAWAPDDIMRALSARYDHADAADLTLLNTLEAPADRLTHRVRETLAALGLSAHRFRMPPRGTAHADQDGGVGGPFVPLPAVADGSPFAAAATRLQSALATAEDLKSVLPHVPLKAPLPGALAITSPFGPRIDPFLGRAALHTGVDLRGVYGDAVHATAPGRVTFAGFMGGYGNLVEVDNGDGLATRYAHLSSIDVVQGETVAAGTVVGHIGDTGRATGPHLHYEVRIDGQPVDPERFLRAGAVLQSAMAL